MSRRPGIERIGTAEHFRWLEGLVKALLLLNLLDAIFTLYWVRAGFAREANELMRDLVNDHAVAFVAVKLGLVSMGSWLLWNHRESAAAVIAIFAAFFVYYLLLLYHLQYGSLLVRHLLAG